MSKLKTKKLSEIGNIVTGNTPPTKNTEFYNSNDIPFYKPNDILENEITDLINSTVYVSERARLKCRILPAKSVLTTCIGTIGKVGVSTCECTCNQQINAIIPNDQICDYKYVAYAILSKKKLLNNVANAPVVPIINKTQFSNIEIFLPSLEEQHEIAAKLDAVSVLLKLRKQKLTELDKLIQSVFYDMFGDPAINKKKWIFKTLQEMLNDNEILGHLDGNHGSLYPRTEEFINSGVPYIGANSIVDGTIEFNKAKYLSKERARQFKKGVAIDGDVLFAHNATVGPVAILHTANRYVILSTSLTYYRCNPEKINNYYLMSFMKTPFYVGQYSKIMSQTTRNQVPITAQRRFLFMVPPISFQNRFSAITQKIEEQKSLVKRSINETQELLNSLMSEYFD